jgi:hypothetical protein
MLYSYRHPDSTEALPGHAQSCKAPEPLPESLKERRQSSRSIPVPTVTESNDDEAWKLWNQALELVSR